MRKKIIIGLEIVSALIILFFVVRHEVKVYNTIALQNEKLNTLTLRVNMIDEFLYSAFKDEADAFIKDRNDNLNKK